MPAARPPFAALLLALISLAGCASPTPPEFGPPPEGPPGPALAVAPLVRDYVPTLEEPADEQGERPLFTPPFRIALDPAAVQSRLGAALAQRGGFARVEALGADDAGAARSGWRLEVSLDDAEVRLVETNGLHGVKVGILIVSSILIFPAVDPFNWFIPGEDYAVTLHASWRLVDANSGAKLAGGRVRSRAWDSFAAFGPGPTRPFYVIGFLRTPGCIDPEEWQEIGAQLLEQAQEQLVVDLVHEVEAARRPPQRSERPR